MSKSRLEAFSDGVIAIIITIMVLELKVPHGSDLAALRPLLPTFLSYVLSFVFIGIYWNNHHHLIHAAEGVNGRMLWANLHLLFWLSLIPFSTAWLGENGGSVPTALYGVNMLAAGVSYSILLRTMTIKNERIRRALERSHKGTISLVVYVASVPLALVSPYISYGCFVFVALVWLVPDRRIERALTSSD
jgi:uncharacterized membrane protein